MEFLFTVEWASTEAILVLVCVGIFVAIFSYDGYIFLKNLFHVFFPKKQIIVTTEEDILIEPISETPITSPSWETVTPEVHDAEEEVVSENIIPESPKETEVLTEEVQAITEEDSVVNEPEQEVDEPILTDIANTNITGDVSEPVEVTVDEIETTEEVNLEEDGIIEDVHMESPSDGEKQEVLQDSPEIAHMDNQEEVIENVPDTTTIEESSFESPIVEESADDIAPEATREIPKASEELLTPKQEGEQVAPRIPEKNNTEALFAIINNARTFIARGQFLEARGIIIQGLALEKDNRELNTMLAGLYEQDRQFEKAEYIYKDLALMYPNDVEILEKLGNVLIIEKRYEIALEMYRKIRELTGETEGTLYILAHLSNELGQLEMVYEYGKKYQKQWPNNPEILTLISSAEIALGKRQDAIQTLIKLKNLTPYNHEIAQMIQKLVLEEELAGNFNSGNP